MLPLLKNKIVPSCFPVVYRDATNLHPFSAYIPFPLQTQFIVNLFLSKLLFLASFFCTFARHVFLIRLPTAMCIVRTNFIFFPYCRNFFGWYNVFIENVINFAPRFVENPLDRDFPHAELGFGGSYKRYETNETKAIKWDSTTTTYNRERQIVDNSLLFSEYTSGQKIWNLDILCL